jgi:sterol desaturase/sphingolipid hydroxylase (fatty acid hydroxylase superfamily)
MLAFYSCRAFGLPMGFYETFICYEHIMFVEAFGHSGLRIHATPPITAASLLRYFNLELVIEDHDLHHRTGWKKSHNYGKQTRFWDTIFGTKAERSESRSENIDYDVVVRFPIFG